MAYQNTNDQLRNLYAQAGSPNGPYNGSYDQNMGLLNQINNGGIGPNSLSSDISAPAVGAAPDPNTPLFQSLNDYWKFMEPGARASAMEVVDPELLRQLARDKTGLQNNLAQTGAGDFSGGWGQLGSLQADAQRQREAQVQDFLNLYKTGFEQLWYDPTLEAWTKSLTTKGANPVNAPQDWASFVAQYGPGLNAQYTSGLQGSTGKNPYQQYMPGNNQPRAPGPNYKSPSIGKVGFEPWIGGGFNPTPTIGGTGVGRSPSIGKVGFEPWLGNQYNIGKGVGVPVQSRY